MSAIIIEAESMFLSGGYLVESGSFASNGGFIGLRNGPTGSATTTFAGPTGFYDIVVGYYDESDGESQFTVTLDGNPVETWTGDNSPGGSRARGSNLTRRTLTNRVFLTNGSSVLGINGVQEGGENARVDYFELIPSGPANGAPTAQPDTYAATEDTTLVTPVASGVLANDSDPENNPLTVSAFDSNSANGGVVNIGGDGAFTFTPAANFTGADSFNYTISDGNGNTTTATVTVNVSGVNDAPTTAADSFSTVSETPLTITANDLLNNDSDVDGDSLSLLAVSDPANGALTANGNGGYLYTPNNGFTGSDSFTYTVSDGNGETATGSVSLTVTPADSGTPPPDPNPNAGPVRIEAENMDLSGGYRVESKSFASNDQFIGLKNGSTGSATTTFMGPTGYYDIEVGYFDESDGASQFNISINGDSIDSWTGNNSPGGTRATAQNFTLRTVGSNVLLTNGSSLLELSGVRGNGEIARFDYIDLLPSGAGTETNPPDPDPDPGTTPVSAGPGIILNAQTGMAFSPIFGALETPRLMPLGDSITAGQHSSGAVPGGYRIQFWDRAVADGLSIDFVGGENNSSGSLVDGDHEGHPGWKISQLKNLVQDGLLSQHPTDVVLAMAGTNDVNNGASAATMINRIGQLIDEVANASPNTKLLVSSLPPLDAPRGSASEAQNVLQFNALLPNLIDQKAAEGKQVFFVDAGGALTVQDLNGDNSATSDLNDGLHPTATGYDKLGDALYDAVFNPEVLADTTNLTGSEFNDWLTGNNSSNIFNGGAGQDKLTGGGGTDKFVYDNSGHGVDQITDFSNNDLLQISASGFGGDLIAGMTLDSSSFISGSNPMSLGSQSTFLYNTNANTLSFDQDGSGNGSEVAIATFSNNHNLQLSQIEIV